MRLKKVEMNITTDRISLCTRVLAISLSSRAKKCRWLTRSVKKSLVARSSNLLLSRARALDHPRRPQVVQRIEQQQKAGQQRRHHGVKSLARLLFLWQAVHGHLAHLDAHGLVHGQGKAVVIIAIDTTHGGRRDLRRAAAGQALRLLGNDGARQVHGAVHALTHIARHLLLRSARPSRKSPMMPSSYPLAWSRTLVGFSTAALYSQPGKRFCRRRRVSVAP
jgi:hypothetical protein